jgi:MFS family permease
LQDRHFRRFWTASAISLFGDHLSFVALPWLVLKLTGDPLAMGSVLAVAAIPRAVFMLFGGAMCDRWSPRVVMIWSNLFRFVLISLLAALTYLGVVSLPMIIGIAFCFGLADSFLFPAASAMPPRLLDAPQLAAGNGLLQGAMQVTLVFGPLVGGVLIAVLGDPAENAESLTDRVALSIVFTLDALTFVVALSLLLLVRERDIPYEKPSGSVVSSIMDGLRWAWSDVPVRTFVLIMAAVSLVFRGPFMVGVPALANTRLAEGAAAFGVIMSALGIGSLIGAIVAGSTRPLPDHWLGKLLLLDFALFGSALLVMSQIPNLALIAGLVLAGGIMDGYVIVFVTTWLQRYVPPERLWRVMSVVMFVGQGLFPVSAALAGALAGWNLVATLLIGGSLALVVSVVGLLLRPVRRLGFE